MSATVKRFAPAAVLAVVATILIATATPGIFTIDEDSYIATIVGLRDGSFRLSNTEGLPASRELLAFDSNPTSRQLGTLPVAPNTPTLYAVFALPFSYFGLRGLIALQVLAFVVCAWLVFRVVRRETRRDDLAWLALGAYVLCSYSIEYAQGIWPHALTMALVMGAIDLTSQLRADVPARRAVFYAALAGVCAGFATGMRYQNLVLLLVIGVTLLWTPRRKLAIAGYLLGCALPLTASGAINASRLGSWNPVSKGAAYLAVGRERPKSRLVEDAARTTYARVVDFSAWPPPLPGSESARILPKSQSGAFLILTGVKKSLLQSAPWLAIAMIALAGAWRRRQPRTLLRPLSLLPIALIGMFAAFGYRHDGWCFNQRYLLEVMPVFCVALGIALVDWTPRWRWLAAGFVLGVAIAGAVVAGTDSLGAMIATMKLPVLLAAILAVTWLVRDRWPKCALAATIALGASLGWAATVHVADDVPASRLLRALNAYKLETFEAAVPDDGKPIAIIAYWGTKDAFGPLMLERDIVLVDPWIDEGKDTVMLLDALLRQGRIVYIDRGMPAPLFAALTAGRRVQGSAVRWMVRVVP